MKVGIAFFVTKMVIVDTVASQFLCRRYAETFADVGFECEFPALNSCAYEPRYVVEIAVDGFGALHIFAFGAEPIAVWLGFNMSQIVADAAFNYYAIDMIANIVEVVIGRGVKSLPPILFC